jgi:hypothetical protein
MGFSASSGIDYTLPAAPPLTQPPLSLLDLAIRLIDTQGLTEKLRIANEKAASAAERLADLPGGDEERDQGGEADSQEDAARTLKQLRSEYQQTADETSQFASDLANRLAELSRWEHGLVYTPELGNAEALETFAPDSGATKNEGSNQTEAPFYWYDPYVAVARDERSLFGWPNTDFGSRALRANRALLAHEPWQVEQEFWSGVRIPTNYHLTASPSTPTTSPHRTIDAWPNPTPAPGTVLGTAVGLVESMSALDQAIADASAGNGMIHATPYLVQVWAGKFNYLRDSDGKVYTVNHNLLVPGYGYAGTGPDAAGLTLTDLVISSSTTGATSATGGFDQTYIGRQVTVGSGGTGTLNSPTYIESVTDAHTVVLSQVAATSGTAHVSVSGMGGRVTGAAKQWAYATEQVYTLRGDVATYPYDLREGSPLVTVDNSIDVRAERSWGTVTNRLLRAAVLIDTTVA